MGAIFLSASVPLRGRQGHGTASPFLIREAVSALVEVVLGRRLLIWGGHPAITPMIWAAADSLGLEYGRTVRLFQSLYFRDQFPEDNARFKNVVYTEAVGGNRDTSLRRMREQMLRSASFEAAVFIGGMEGIQDEHEMFKEMAPNAKIVAMPSPGGVARTIFQDRPELPREMQDAIDFSNWFYRLLAISPREERRSQLG